MESSLINGTHSPLDFVRQNSIPVIEGIVQSGLFGMYSFVNDLEKKTRLGEVVNTQAGQLNLTPEITREALGEARTKELDAIIDSIKSLLSELKYIPPSQRQNFFIGAAQPQVFGDKTLVQPFDTATPGDMPQAGARVTPPAKKSQV